MLLKVHRTANAAKEKDFDHHAHVIVVLPKADADLRKTPFPYAETLAQRLRRQDQKQWPSAPLTVDLPNAAGTRATLATVSPLASTFELLTLARKLVTPHTEQRPETLGIALVGLDDTLAKRCAEALLAALHAATFRLPTYKRDKSPARETRSIAVTVYGCDNSLNVERLAAEADGNNLARRLTSLPPNYLTPLLYRKEIEKLAKEHNWRMTFYDMKRLRKENCGAFLAVAQGSENDEAGIVHLRYAPRGKATERGLALVGKGVCFDTGGNNLKPAKSMHGMHEDMEGSAVALGTLLALSRLQVDFPIDCWLALTENLIGPRAFKQNDVVTASNGTHVEIVHTDAEGRLILADTLHLVSRQKPRLIVDYATLTGACVYALSTRYSGAFCNRPVLHDLALQAGRDSGERVWPFPMDDDFDTDLESQVADIKQCTLAGEADHILAARFLNRFVANTPWLHIDLAAGNNKGGLAHIPSDITGFGVRFTLNLLIDQGALEKLDEV